MKIEKKFLLFGGIALLISGLYFFLRLFNILNLPIFTDEAIYIRWAQIGANDPNWRFISLVDGKQPMFVWIAMILMKFVSDPLLAGRLVSVTAGFATVVGLFFLGNEIFTDRKKEAGKIFEFSARTVSIGLISSFIYVIYPFSLVYDRMALYDSLVGAFAVWSLYLLILLVRSLRVDVALITGLAVGGGLLNKSNAFFSLYSIPFLLILFDFKSKNLKNKLIKFAGLILLVIVLSNAAYAILRLSPFYHIIEEKNALFVYPIGAWLKSPFAFFSKNITALLDWFFIYFSLPALVLAGGSFFIKREYAREKMLLTAWFVFPFIALAFFGNQIYPRFILFMTLPLIPLLSYSLYELSLKYKNIAMRAGILILAFGFYFRSDYFIIFDFARAPIPGADLGQYINDWTAGNGVKQSVEFFKERAEKSKIYVMTQGTFGLMPYALEMYLVDNPNIEINAVWPIGDVPPKEVLEAASEKPTYAIFYQPCPSCGAAGKIPSLWRSKLINRYRQGAGNAYYSIYQILP
jgi:4-amino-4-deoxy-L-arabinose transferase-like glycosyltransferase